jgi:Zn-dependent protease
MGDEKMTKEQQPQEEAQSSEVESEVAEPKKKKGWWGWIAGGLALLTGKLKFVFLPVYTFLKLSKFLTTIVSMVAMIASYALFYGWIYAVGVVALLFIHEMGHLHFSRMKGLPVSAPVFIPFVGAFIKMKEEPKDAATEAFVAIGGPLYGAVAALSCFALALAYNSAFWAALAYFGFLITVFNMIPAHPLDGGRIVSALSPRLWAVGIIAMLVLTFYYFNPISILVLILSVGKVWTTWKRRHEFQEYYTVASGFRWKIGLAYFSIFGVSSFFVYLLHELLRS